MPLLENMPEIQISQEELRPWSELWLAKRAFNKKESMDFGYVFDRRVGQALATMLGGIEIIIPNANDIMPKKPNAVEVGAVRIVGGIRPQNYDVGYRPDGVRFAFDSKTLNSGKSLSKNFQNMINDLGTEATTVHTRFPFAVVAFMVIMPTQCFVAGRRKPFTRMLERLLGRKSPEDLPHKAEAISLVLWSPEELTIDSEWPPPGSLLRIERFSEQVEAQYYERYHDIPPHDKSSEAQKEALKAKGVEVGEAEGEEEGGEED